MKQVRCAIYTRKSSEEGLEQSFNSLDAQREACAAYVLSQAGEGWSALPDTYEDGGLSGGSLARPALQRLLADIELGRVDIVVVYKVDRLTRSLFDFARLVEVFDKAGVSFVSVTQSFNTTTSMGRLTLNMLLSFAQFEREVTAERIRDKLAASKAKGMWMGGPPPVGYAPEGRSLTIIPEQAALVRRIYERYLALGNVRFVADELAEEGVMSPPRVRKSGKTVGGRPFSRGQLYALLRCPTYVGDIPHKETVYPGLHEPIIDRDTWNEVQARLDANIQGNRRGERTKRDSPLSGKVFDTTGAPLIASHACKGARRYRYYISGASSSGQAMRIPATELESAVAECLATAFDDPTALCAAAWLAFRHTDLPDLRARASGIAARVRSREPAFLRQLVSKVAVHDERVVVSCDAAAVGAKLGLKLASEAPAEFTLEAQVRLRRSGHVMRLIQDNGAALAASPSQSMIKLLVKARRWWAILRTGVTDITRLAASEGVTASYMTRVVRTAFLSPTVVEAILAGSAKAQVDAAMLMDTGTVVPSWTEQARRLLPA